MSKLSVEGSFGCSLGKLCGRCPQASEFFKILLVSVVLVVAYGILHDQVTAHLCVEYFTIGHPLIFGTKSPALLAIGWGIIATWWAGVVVGLPLSVVARIGRRPKLSATDLLKPALVLLSVMGVAALVAGCVGFLLARWGQVWLIEPLASLVPQEKHLPFIADLWAHSASYGFGFFGGVILCIYAWIRRGRLKRESELRLRGRNDV